MSTHETDIYIVFPGNIKIPAIANVNYGIEEKYIIVESITIDEIDISDNDLLRQELAEEIDEELQNIGRVYE